MGNFVLPDGSAVVPQAVLVDDVGRSYRVDPALAEFIERAGGSLTVTLRPAATGKMIRPTEAARIAADRIVDRDDDPDEYRLQVDAARKRIARAVRAGEIMSHNRLIDRDSFMAWIGSDCGAVTSPDRIRAAAQAIRAGGGR